MTTPPSAAVTAGAPAAGIEAALASAERVLAETADAINPATPQPDLLRYAAQYRARLSTLAAACRGRSPARPAPTGN